MNPLQEDGQEKTVHPFFQKPLKPTQAQSIQNQYEPEIEKTSKRGVRKSERFSKSLSAEKDSKKQNGTSESSKSANGEQADLLEVDPNNCRRKRQKTASPEARAEVEIEESATTTTPAKAKQLRASKHKQTTLAKTNQADVTTLEEPVSHDILVNIGVSRPSENGAFSDSAPRSKLFEDNLECETTSASTVGDSTKSILDETLKSKKVLQFNPKTGTIGSPPRKAVLPKKRGKAYGGEKSQASEVGAKIEDILSGIKRSIPNTEILSKDVKDTKELTLRKGNGVDIIPWWKTAKKKAPVPEVQESSKSQQSNPERGSSLGKLPSPSKIISTLDDLVQMKSNCPRQSFGGFGVAPKAPRFPGAIEPAWPWSGMVHVRGEREEECLIGSTATAGISRKKGGKYKAVRIDKDEDIISTMAAELRIDETINSIQDLHIDDFAPIPPCLRVPSKHIESGLNLQRRIQRELVSKLSKPIMDEESSDHEMQEPDANRSNAHPALANLYNSISTSLSAFDRAECENQSWTHKYAPERAEEILQTGREAFILKDWLQNLTVMSIESGSTENKASKKSSSKAELTGKRKRKSKKLDGFVISSGEEDNDMDEITETEDENFLGRSRFVQENSQRPSGYHELILQVQGTYESQTQGRRCWTSYIARPEVSKETAAPKGPPKQQKQSLILLEEIDVLYEEDRGFWQTKLDFWCQFAIGDRKAGMEWFYPRLPVGCDVDEHGRKFRVVSEGTYQTGMGWLCQDTLENQRPYIDIEEETLHESWDGWCIDVGDWQQNLGISTWANKIKHATNDRPTERAALAMYDDFAEVMSATDSFSHYSFGTDKQIIIDASHPKLSSKVREDFTLANQLLDVSPQVIYDETSIDISLWMKSRAREVLQIRQHVEHGWESFIVSLTGRLRNK
ncbi:hypothetical protein EYC84_002929 [Monilinia fructicola]|uniref:Uncharacterized protein n=1 Tax=Monilinia fructicola TaxID=38448 RepID=A0A5M9JV26_MONFR|nr:hypothetical protein EYC84_002929 [Monilinia fructicola]